MEMTIIHIPLWRLANKINNHSKTTTFSSYNDKRVIEKDKNKILSYKYLLTKTIQREI